MKVIKFFYTNAHGQYKLIIDLVLTKMEFDVKFYSILDKLIYV